MVGSFQSYRMNILPRVHPITLGWKCQSSKNISSKEFFFFFPLELSHQILGCLCRKGLDLKLSHVFKTELSEPYNNWKSLIVHVSKSGSFPCPLFIPSASIHRVPHNAAGTGLSVQPCAAKPTQHTDRLRFSKCLAKQEQTFRS